MQPKPITSKRLAQRNAFWNATSVKIHDPKFAIVPRPGVKRQKNIQPATEERQLRRVKR
jgi:hypothetical protein